MTGHKMVVEFQVDCLNMHAVCEEPEGASCRWASECDCETYTELFNDDQGWYHETEEAREDAGGVLYVEVQHRHVPSTSCNYVNWFSEDDALEEAISSGQTFEVGRFNIVPEWTDEYYQWRKA